MAMEMLKVQLSFIVIYKFRPLKKLIRSRVEIDLDYKWNFFSDDKNLN